MSGWNPTGSYLGAVEPVKISPRERADKVRAILNGDEPLTVTVTEPPEPLLPPGSLVLTADEAETVRKAGEGLYDSIEDIVALAEVAEVFYVGELDNWTKALALLSPEANVEPGGSA